MRLIDADALLDKTVKKNGSWKSITNSEGENLEEIVSEMPTVQAVPIDVLDKISAEIDENISHYEHFLSSNTANGLMIAKKIIDKYRAESEES